MKEILVEFDPSWVLRCNAADVLPSEETAKFVEFYGFGQVRTKTFTELVLYAPIQSDEELESFRQLIVNHLAGVYNESHETLAALISVRAQPTPDPKARIEQLKEAAPDAEFLNMLSDPNEPPAPHGRPTPPSVMENIRALRGADPFVELCEEIHRMAPLLVKRSLGSVITTVGYIFSVDPGCGHTTAVELLSDLLAEHSLLPRGTKPQFTELEAYGGKTNPLKSAVSSIIRNTKRVVSIDISNWSEHLSSPEFRDFLLALREHAGKTVYVFRLPYLEHSVLLNIESAIADVMRVQTVTFTPLSAADLERITRDKLQAKGFTATDAAWERFLHRLAEEKSDGRFYGIKTAEKVMDEMIYLKLQSVLRGTSRDDSVIEGDELALLTAEHDPYISAEARLNSLIGIEGIRDRIFEILSQIEFARKTPGISSPAMHMCFVGNPGTGKTTVARIVGQLLKERDILSKGYFFERSGGDFIGMYVGHTAPKTLALCRDAYGSVLFIDEAYTLTNANYSNSNSFSKEAIDTLISQMENHRDDMVVILAGYPREMEELMRMNPGLSGRIPYSLNFPNYTREQLGQIFSSMAENSPFTLTPQATSAAEAYFASLDERILSASDFANARFVRNLFERVWSKTVTRAQLDGSDPRTITAADFTAAAESAGELNRKQSARSRPGYHLASF